MLDLGRTLGFDWDAGNSRKNLEKHRVSQQEAEQVFVDPRVVVLLDEKHSAEETRHHAFGATAADRPLQVTFTLRKNATLLRVISVRSMSRRERSRYEEES